MATQYATSYDQTTTVTQYSTTQTTSSGVIDRLYIKSIPGILKIVEMVQYAFICLLHFYFCYLYYDA